MAILWLFYGSFHSLFCSLLVSALTHTFGRALGTTGAFFYRYTEAETFTTLSQAIYFTLVTCTTIGYGEMVPSTTGGRLFLIVYSMFGIAAVGAVLLEMGDIMVTASEAPRQWFMRNVVLRLCPGAFPGLSRSTWGAHLVGEDADDIVKRTVWVGEFQAGSVTPDVLSSQMDAHGEIEKVSVHWDLAGVGEKANAASGKWGLVTFKARLGEAFVPGSSPVEAALAAAEAHDMHTVLPAVARVIGRRSLQEGGSLQSQVRVVLAIVMWLFMLCGIGPLYGMHSHHWTYEQALYFSYITMSTIGYGDFFPNNGDAVYPAACTGDAIQPPKRQFDGTEDCSERVVYACGDFNENQTGCEYHGCDFFAGTADDLHHHVVSSQAICRSL